MSAKLIHKACGHQIGWYLPSKPRYMDKAHSKDVVFIDGTVPGYCSKVEIECSFCDKPIARITDMERIFKDG